MPLFFIYNYGLVEDPILDAIGTSSPMAIYRARQASAASHNSFSRTDVCLSSVENPIHRC